MNWNVRPEFFGTSEATRLRRDYYDEVASRYWRRPATAAEIDEGLADDPPDRLTPPTGEFVVGRYEGVPQSCGGVLLLDGPGSRTPELTGAPGPARVAELTRVYVRPAVRGTGGGHALLAALEAAARRLGATRMVLDTRLDLVEARGLYAACGYAEIPAYSEGPYSEIWFGKDLAAAP
ncbi:GNAT family N-acetyltransferase [Streptomyces sp. NPDC057307]|uniref:GNAT family N-acetyltransferase n=1 Tax=Streptomyces sp. NPDC057307 TaxID=3346096 RepID=UPI003629BC53